MNRARLVGFGVMRAIGGSAYARKNAVSPERSAAQKPTPDTVNPLPPVRQLEQRRRSILARRAE